ncbi:UNVERIFIED_CONTAM: Inactive protein kinase SELMODRAFT [Sesamum radiatum]|uniref:Inactive protein kinase SELMODRAFT n=1 Tax=Sesamum radiatum TaxID=300843 RepID=A0AAW2V7H6_SESRA
MENLSSSSSLRFQPWIAQVVSSHRQSSKHLGESSGVSSTQSQNSATKTMLEKLSRLDEEPGFRSPSYRSNLDFSGSLREAISLSRTAPPGPPPLCSICQHKAPVFGKPPRWFSYAELELATGGFSQANFLAEGGFGSVHEESFQMARQSQSSNTN